MERTPHWSSQASSDTVSFTLTYHTWQFIIFTIFTITAYIFSYSFSLLFWIQDLAFWQILSSIDLFLYYRTDSTDSRNIQFFSAQRLDLFAWCVMTKPALSRFSNALKIIALSFHFIDEAINHWWGRLRACVRAGGVIDDTLNICFDNINSLFHITVSVTY